RERLRGLADVAAAEGDLAESHERLHRRGHEAERRSGPPFRLVRMAGAQRPVARGIVHVRDAERAGETGAICRRGLAVVARQIRAERARTEARKLDQLRADLAQAPVGSE